MPQLIKYPSRPLSMEEQICVHGPLLSPATTPTRVWPAPRVSSELLPISARSFKQGWDAVQ